MDSGKEECTETEASPKPPLTPLRFAVMLPRYSMYGGVEQFGYRLSQALAERGHSVDFICARQEAAPPQGVRIVTVGRPPGGRALKLLWFLLGAERIRRNGEYNLTISLGKTLGQDIIRMGGGPLRIFWEKSEKALAPGWPRIVKRLKRRLSPVNWLTLLVEKRQFTEKSEVVAVSHLVRDWMLEAHPDLRPENVSVIYNRPDLKRFFPPQPQEKSGLKTSLATAHALQGIPQQNVFIGTASTNFELKGIGPLIRAMAQLPVNTYLFIAGGRAHGSYVALAESLGVADRVIFCGKVEDMPSFYRAMDVFILPTFYDACSNAVLEALASGCKVLTSACNGSAFFLKPEQIFPDPGDVDELVRRLASAIAEEQEHAPFAWPETVPNGLEAFVAHFEQKALELRETRKNIQKTP